MLYSIKKKIIRYRKRLKETRDNAQLKQLSIEQMKVFKMIKELAVKHNSEIVFDPQSDEIIFNLPKMLVTMKSDTVHIHNTNGFISMNLPAGVYQILVEIIYKEGHKERRRLKNEAKKRINSFLDEIIKLNE